MEQPFTCRDKEHHKILQALKYWKGFRSKGWKEIRVIALWDASKMLKDQAIVGYSLLVAKRYARIFRLNYKQAQNIDIRHPKISRCEISEIVLRLHESGLKASQIAKIFDRSKAWVAKSLRYGQFLRKRDLVVTFHL